MPEFRRRTPPDVPYNPKAGDGPPSRDMPAGGGKKLPKWAKWVIGTNVGMAHLVVVLVGIQDIPFTLDEVALAAYVVTGLGIPIGLANQAVRGALAGLFGAKS